MKKYKSIGFWVGIAGAMLAATGSQLSDLTTWASVGDLFISTIMNPCTLFGVCMATYGAWNNPTERGLN